VVWLERHHHGNPYDFAVVLIRDSVQPLGFIGDQQDLDLSFSSEL
jgi:hypothetical protein